MEGCADGGEEEGRCPVQKKQVVVVMGSTGVGKSQLAIDLALALQKQQQQGRVAEIINADSMQVYRGFPIATAKGTSHNSLYFYLLIFYLFIYLSHK